MFYQNKREVNNKKIKGETKGESDKDGHSKLDDSIKQIKTEVSIHDKRHTYYMIRSRNFSAR